MNALQTGSLCYCSEMVIALRLSVKDKRWPVLPLEPCPEIVTKVNLAKYLSVNNPGLFSGNIR